MKFFTSADSDFKFNETALEVKLYWDDRYSFFVCVRVEFVYLFSVE